jgi:hypothetical protein
MSAHLRGHTCPNIFPPVDPLVKFFTKPIDSLAFDPITRE